MTINTYQEIIRTSEKRAKTAIINLRLMYSICGLIEELEELEGTAYDLSLIEPSTEEEILEKAGNIYYYIANIATETNISLKVLLDKPLPQNHKFVNPARILRKAYSYEALPEKYKLQLWDYLAFILQVILPAYVDVETCLKANIEKHHKIQTCKIVNIEDYR